MATEIERPSFVKEKHLLYLDALRASGITNMYGASPYLQNAFKELGRKEAIKVLGYWMETFVARHPEMR